MIVTMAVSSIFWQTAGLYMKKPVVAIRTDSRDKHVTGIRCTWLCLTLPRKKLPKSIFLKKQLNCGSDDIYLDTRRYAEW